MATADPGPVPLRLPSILQNPVNKTQRQVEAYNAQQREKAAARRESDKADQISGSKRGKRVTRRLNNDAFVDNPHAVAFKRADLAPSVPLHPRPLRPSFPSSAIERSAPIPSAAADRTAPGAPSSQAGAFSTSLKGTRQLLRKRGRRSEVLVPIVEEHLRAWLAGNFTSDDTLGWHVVDAADVPFTPAAVLPPAGPSRRLPPQHQVRAALPPLPVLNGTVPAILELSRSPAHISWAVPDSFDRLVVHLVARYYELASWSEDQRTASGDRVRLTHLVRPALVKPRLIPAHALLTPETSDASASSSSEVEPHASSSDSDSDATEVAHSDHDPSDAEYDADTSLTARYADLDSDSDAGGSDTDSHALSLSDRLGALGLEPPSNGHSTYAHGHGLHRVTSHGSSAYASSEGGSEAGLGASVMFSPSASAAGLPPLPEDTLMNGGPAAPRRLPGSGGGDWSDRPTFFEFVYGA